jgi:hypothetical protein
LTVKKCAFSPSDSGADVISLSHGGVPAAVLEEAVDRAYENGVPIFAASGDFLGGWILSTPKTTVFPARYNQVMTVTGADAAYLSAGDHCALILCVWKFWGGNGFGSNAFSWLVGTNYGPTDLMQGHAIAAYTPNITFYSAHPDLKGMSDAEMGTSAAVPQVAAAAAMWLQMHREEIRNDRSDGAPLETGSWRTWRKTESVYQALLSSGGARPSTQDTDRPDAYKSTYLGAGILDAQKLINKNRPYQSPGPCLHRAPSHADTFWWIDALGSMTIFDVVGEPVHASPTEAAAVRDALFASLTTELTQLSFRNQALRAWLSRRTAQLRLTDDSGCTIEHVEVTGIARDEWQRLARLIHLDRYASPEMRRAADQLARARET